MKRFLCVVLALFLPLFWLSCSAESDIVEFDAKIVDAFDYNTEKWFSTSMNRALLSILLTLQVASDDVTGQSMWTKTLANQSFIVNTGITLDYYGVIEDYIIVISYCPLIKYANYLIKHTYLTVSENEQIVSEVIKRKGDEYYENSQSDILICTSMLSDAVK